MGRWGRVIPVLLLMAIWSGCNHETRRTSLSRQAPVIRVRILQDQSQVMITTREAPILRAASDSQPKRLDIPSGTQVALSLTPGGWLAGNIPLGTGILKIEPVSDGSITINGMSWRGDFRLVPLPNGHFDVINDVDIDSYLKGVIAREMLWGWDEEAFCAQAIAARTYALFEARTTGVNRYWDVYPDQRSQVYGGLSAETRKSRDAVDATAGIVLAYGPAGREKIFKTYFSSCCGGVTMSAADNFNEPYIEPLGEQNVGALCSASPRFRWGPIDIRKDELTRRFKLWGTRQGRPEKDMGPVVSIDLQAVNRYGRPTRFLITDARGVRYSWSAEQLRWATNTDPSDGATLNSGFVKPIPDPDDPASIRFSDGRGWGHGVGMCQWCTQARAQRGMAHEDILLLAYKGAKLVHAY